MIGFQSDVSFPAIVGQERLKRALLAVAANDAIDGLLIQGEKGTAKSTAVRGLVDLLPTQQVVANCPYGCPPGDPSRQCESCRAQEDPPVEERPVPLVSVPLGAARERVVGSLSLSDALNGESSFEPGLLAQANRGFLYVDEVNLLEDHLVDVLLDAAASGVNRVEHDGMSETHPAEFTLIGTMNPEEGDLRPQLRDRFALQIDVAGSENLDERVAIVESALARDEGETAAAHDQNIERLRQTVVNARASLESVTLERELVETIAEVCVDANVDGHRGDIAAARAATTFAALDGRSRVTEADIEEALRFALPHRLESRPFEETTPLEDVLEDHFGDDVDAEGENEGGEADDSDRGNDSPHGEVGGADGTGDQEGGANDDKRAPPAPEQADPDGDHGGQSESSTGGANAGSNETGVGMEAQTGGETEEASETESGEEEQTVRPPSEPTNRAATPGTSRGAELDLDPPARSETDSTGTGRVKTEPQVDAVGPRIRSEPAELPENVDVTASVTAAAKRGSSSLERRDLRQSIRAGSATALVVFAVDASASMRPAMRAAKGTVLELLKESYEERDEVAFVAFAGEGAEVLLPPTDSVSLAARHLKDLPAGDQTPLPAGLATTKDVIDRADPAASVAVVVTDGRTNIASGSPTAATREAAEALGQRADEVLVVDASQPEDRATLIEEILTAAEARSIPLEELSEESVYSVAISARK